ncbi:MAG: hypothetical protein K6C98_00300, partial [Treponema sp.]|nr:hypothetical protein [Treponema sp.]
MVVISAPTSRCSEPSFNISKLMLQDSFADTNAMKKSIIYPVILFFVILALYTPIYGQENASEMAEGVLFEFRQKKG